MFLKLKNRSTMEKKEFLSILKLIAMAIFMFAVIFMLFILASTYPAAVNAQTKQPAIVDTIECHYACIKRMVEKPTANGKTKTYAVYDCKHLHIQDIIPVSKTTMDYIALCRENDIVPSLGIRVRNSQITSIVKIKKVVR